MTDILLLIYSGTNMILMIWILFTIHTLKDTRNSEYSNVEKEEVAEDSVDSEELTESEKERVEREKEFDLRIVSMKNELANQRKYIEEIKENEALVLHPGIQNLPHNIIGDTHDNLPDVEITI